VRTMRLGFVLVTTLALVAFVAWPAGGTYTGFTVTPPGATVGSNLTITATLTGGTETCDGIGLRVFLLPPVAQGDTTISENGLGVAGSHDVLLDITPDDIATPGIYRIRVECALQEVDTIDFPVTEAPPTSTTEPPTTTTAPVDEPLVVTPTFTG
jgi:hypothetical protein